MNRTVESTWGPARLGSELVPPGLASLTNSLTNSDMAHIAGKLVPIGPRDLLP